jgi:hypothetical protein
MEKNNEPKMSILIDKQLHNKLKIFCAINGLVIQRFVEKAIENKMDENEK